MTTATSLFSPAETPIPQPDIETQSYEFRWDVEVPVSERRFGQKFMKQWKRVLQAQKMGPLVSAKLSPVSARFQLCVESEADTNAVRAHEAEVAEELAHLRWSGNAQQIAGEPAGTHPAGWQGVRVWVAFSRRDVEAVLGKKAKI
jgi:hypothetical protein